MNSNPARYAKATFSLVLLSLSCAQAGAQPVWDYIPSWLNVNLARHAVATPGDNKVYVIGGDNYAGGAHNGVFRYSPLIGQWDSPGPAPLPRARKDHSAVTGIDGRIYVIGGLEVTSVPKGTPTSTVVAYDPRTNAWAYVASLTTVRVKPAVAVAGDGRIYVFGGTDVNFSGGPVPVLTAESFDPLQPQAGWSKVQSISLPPTELEWRATADHQGNIELFSLKNRYTFNFATQQLTLISSSSLSSGYTITTGQDGNIHVINPGGYSDRVGLPWFLPNSPPLLMMQQHARPEATPAEGSIFAMDGDAQEFLSPIPAYVNSKARAFLRFDSTFASSACNAGTPAAASAIFTGGRVKQAASFNGTQMIQYAPSGCFNVGSGSFSIDFWIRPTNTSGTTTVLDKRVNNSSGYFGYHVALYNGKLLLQMASGTYGNYISTSGGADGLGQAPVNQWTHVAFVVDRWTNTGRIWLNGVFAGSFTPLAGNLDNAAPMRIGAHSFSGASYKGDLDELQIHNRALTWQEIRSIFLAGKEGKL